MLLVCRHFFVVQFEATGAKHRIQLSPSDGISRVFVVVLDAFYARTMASVSANPNVVRLKTNERITQK